MRKVLLVIMTIILIITFTGSVNVYAGFNDLGGPPTGGGGTTDIIEGELSIYSDGTTTSSAVLYTSFRTLFSGTHSFIVFENTGNVSYYIGVYYIDPGETITFGIYGNRVENNGVWYNLESHLIDTNTTVPAYEGSVSLTIMVDDDDISLIHSYILNNNTWSIDYNCSSFAADVWNQISEIYLDPYNSIIDYDTPRKLANEIKEISGYSEGLQFDSNTTVGYFGYTIPLGLNTFIECIPGN